MTDLTIGFMDSSFKIEIAYQF